jgi:hypothetical protein
MDEGLNTFINSLSIEDFNKGEYKSKRPSDMQRMADMLTNAELEPIMTAPDGMKESNLGLLAYEKTILRFDYAREQVLARIVLTRLLEYIQSVGL